MNTNEFSQYFTRQEAIALTNTTSSRLAYLEKIGVIVPEKFGSLKKPTVLYSWRQLLQIQAVMWMSEFISLVALKRTVQFLNTVEFWDELTDKNLIIADTEIYTCAPDFSDLPDIMETVSKQYGIIGQPITIVSSLKDLSKHICQQAMKSPNIDFSLFEAKLKLNGVTIHPFD